MLSTSPSIETMRWLLRLATSNRLQSLARTKHSRIEIQSRSGFIAHRLEPRNARIEIILSLPLRRTRESREMLIGNLQPPLNRR